MPRAVPSPSRGGSAGPLREVPEVHACSSQSHAAQLQKRREALARESPAPAQMTSQNLTPRIRNLRMAQGISLKSGRKQKSTGCASTEEAPVARRFAEELPACSSVQRLSSSSSLVPRNKDLSDRLSRNCSYSTMSTFLVRTNIPNRPFQRVNFILQLSQPNPSPMQGTGTLEEREKETGNRQPSKATLAQQQLGARQHGHLHPEKTRQIPGSGQRMAWNFQNFQTGVRPHPPISGQQQQQLAREQGTNRVAVIAESWHESSRRSIITSGFETSHKGNRS